MTATRATDRTTNVLSPQQVEFYDQHGWLRIPRAFTPSEVDELRADLDWILDTWSSRTMWTGGWRKELMEPNMAKRAKIDALHDLHLFSDAWARAVSKRKVCGAISDLLHDAPVELHHSTMHVKPPESGMPFPVHQDYPFYEHKDGRYVDVLVHLDDTCHDNGEIRFLDGSHRKGPLDHVQVSGGKKCTPHLPTDAYRLEDTIPVPAKAGDLVCFNLHTIHGSYLNATSEPRRLVRVGYRHPDNIQLSGQAMGRPGLLVWGRRGFTRKPPAQLVVKS